MLEGILLTAVLGYVFGYVALKGIHFLIDWETERDCQKIRQRIDEEQKRWLSSPEFQKLNQERLNRLQSAQLPERTESLPLY